jgi:hypothetical protein
MGFLDNALKKLKVEAEKKLEEINRNKSEDAPSASSKHDSNMTRTDSNSSNISLTMSEVMHYGSHATRWEKTVVATDSIVAEVTKFDPDGVEIVCVGGESPDGSLDNDNESDIEWHKGINDTQGLEEIITTRIPGGPCPLGKTMERVLETALENTDGLKETPCSVLVLTAGKPDDSDLLEKTLQKAAQTVADNGGVEKCPLSVTFIQIGNDKDASDYLKYLDKKMVGISDETGETIDIVDTMGFQELKDTMDSMREHEAEKKAQEKQSGKKGTIFGAVAGAAMGVGGMYLYDKQKAKKRVTGGSWGGQWKCSYENEEITTLTVVDDGAGNLTIDGLEDTMEGVYFHKKDDDEREGAAVDADDFFIQFTEPSGEVVDGTFDAENFALNWSDGTSWEALDPHSSWAGYLGAATAGATVLGATGYAIDKKFFRKIGDAETCDYVLVLDRSAKMAIIDGGK